MIRLIAKQDGDDCEPDPWAWYENKYEEEADYSRLIKTLGHSPSDRKQILRSYFEPTPDEVEQHVKVPGKAHRAIAKIVKSGHVRVILTTNFDRLIQSAITDEGVTPIVISTPDGIKGALPLNHANCAVFKLHVRLVARTREIINWVRQWLPDDAKWPEFEPKTELRLQKMIL